MIIEDMIISNAILYTLGWSFKFLEVHERNVDEYAYFWAFDITKSMLHVNHNLI